MTAGSETYGDSQTLYSTSPLQSETLTTTESLSASATDAAAGTADTSLDQSTLTDTLTSYAAPTLTETDSGTITLGTSDVVSGGTFSEWIYQTGGNSAPDLGTGTFARSMGNP